MEILCFSGIPGSGKTLDSTYESLRHYRRQNRALKRYFAYAFALIPGRLGKNARMKRDYIRSFPYNRINNVYSTYPILLDKKRQIYSLKWSIWDFDNKHSFLPDALFVNDEIQLYVDSDEYDDKIKKKYISYVAKFMQSARHFGCSGIILCTQHPSRLFKKARNVASGFVQHKKMFVLPIFKIGFIKTIQYFILEDYGKFIPKSREERKKLPFEYKKKIKFMNFNKIFNSYDSRYLAQYNYEKPLYPSLPYKSLKMEYKDIAPIFEQDGAVGGGASAPATAQRGKSYAKMDLVFH